MSLAQRPEQEPITSPRSDRVRRIASLSGRSARRRTGLLRVEGPQAVRSLLAERPDLAREVFLTASASLDHPELAALAERAGVRTRPVEEDVLRAMVRGGEEAAALPSPQGAVAVAAVPDLSWRDALDRLSDRTTAMVVVLDELRDPGNVGTVIRTADAAGADLVVLAAGSADPTAPKVVRASAGSLFHLPVVTGAPMPELLAALRDRDIAAIATSGHADQDVYTADLPERLAWILGNEAHGVDADTLAHADLRVRIPLAGRAESLNVAIAATVCLFETLRRRTATTAS